MQDKNPVNLQPMYDWFKIAKPNPLEKDLSTQLGAHFEEVCELIVALSNEIVMQQLSTSKNDLHNKLVKAQIALNDLSQAFYKDTDFSIKHERVEVLDALADQAVTLSGIAYFADMKWNDALTEVNQSNYSKFKDGKPLLNEDRKIMKGKDYFPPKLESFV